jgi:hypothetical protein
LAYGGEDLPKEKSNRWVKGRENFLVIDSCLFVPVPFWGQPAFL